MTFNVKWNGIWLASQITVLYGNDILLKRIKDWRKNCPNIPGFTLVGRVLEICRFYRFGRQKIGMSDIFHISVGPLDRQNIRRYSRPTFPVFDSSPYPNRFAYYASGSYLLLPFFLILKVWRPGGRLHLVQVQSLANEKERT